MVRQDNYELEGEELRDGRHPQVVNDRRSAQGLLTNDNGNDSVSQEKASWRNLPNKEQLLLVSLCRLSTPLSNACILPFLYDLVKSVLSDAETSNAAQHVTRMTGFLVAAFPIGQVMTSMLLGRISDCYGRRPVVLLGLLLSIIANIAFGFSRTIGMLCFWRLVSGMANGSVGVLRTMTAELGGRKHQSRVFLAPPVVFNSGRVIAFAVGGCLANPVVNLPGLFGPTGLLNVLRNPGGVEWLLRFPYALPAIFNGAALTICFLAAAFWMRETLSSITREQLSLFNIAFSWIRRILGQKASHQYTLIEIEEKEPESPCTQSVVERPRFGAIWSRNLLCRLIAFALLPLHNASFIHTFPVFLAMPTSEEHKRNVLEISGGLGFTSPQVGLLLATFGIAGILLQLFLYPRLHKSMGTLGVFRLANSLFPIVYTAVPFLALLSRSGLSKWPAIAAILLTQILARTMAIPSSVILLTEVAPSRNVLGTIHGAGNTLSALASACGPAIAGLLMARGIEIKVIGLVWWAWLSAIAIMSLVWSIWGNGEQVQRDGIDLVDSAA